MGLEPPERPEPPPLELAPPGAGREPPERPDPPELGRPLLAPLAREPPAGRLPDGRELFEPSDAPLPPRPPEGPPDRGRGGRSSGMANHATTHIPEPRQSAKRRPWVTVVYRISLRRLSVGSNRRNRKRQKAPTRGSTLFVSINSGGVLLSQGVYPQVPSALTGLTSVFEMGTGVTLSLRPPETCCQRVCTLQDSRASTSESLVRIQALGRLVPVS